MQVLTGQWTKIFTPKFRFDHSDFSVNTSTRLSADIFTMKRTDEIIGAKVFVRETFAAPSLTSANLYIIADTNLVTAGESSRTPVITNLRQVADDFAGQIGFNTHPIQNQLASTGIVARIVTNSISGGAQFTTGIFDVWILTSKLP
jgi:hypothetical protein